MLILGSMPGRESLARSQYYANPRNSFWSIMGEICGARAELPYTDRLARLNQAGITLWDVLMHCEREGSLDVNITNEVPNAFATFLSAYPMIKAVYFNGQKHRSYSKNACGSLLPSLRN